MNQADKIKMLEWGFKRVCERYESALDALAQRDYIYVKAFRGELLDIKFEVGSGKNANTRERHAAILRRGDRHAEHDTDCAIHLGYGLCNCGATLCRR